MALLSQERRDQVLEQLRTSVAPELYETWCRRLEFDECGDRNVEIPVPSEYYRQWVEKELRQPIEGAFQRVFGTVPAITFSIRQGMRPFMPEPPALSTPAPVLQVPPRRLEPRTDLGFALNPQYIFDSFIVGPTNRMAHAAALSIAENPGNPAFNPLFIHGCSGMGKTHLLQAICHSTLRNNPSARIAYRTGEGFVNDFIASIKQKSTEAFRSRYRNLDLLLIDDIHFLADKEGSQEELFHTFNALHTAGRQMIFSADASPHHIPMLVDRLRSRFGAGLAARIDPPTYEMRLAILHQKTEEKGRAFPEDVLSYVAAKIETNIRELEGALNRILANSSLTHRRIDLDLAREALEDLGLRKPVVITPEQIMQAVAAHYGKKINDFKTRRWTKSTSLARHVAIYLTKHLTSLSLMEIGEAFGGKDHSTVLYAVRRIDTMKAGDPEFNRQLEQLGRTLTSQS